MHCYNRRVIRLAPLLALCIASSSRAAIPIWPLSGTTAMQDAMHTSFGPRVNYGSWDMHDGIDLPAAIGTTCYAILPGTIFRASDADGVYDNRHVVLRCVAADGTTLYVNYLHLSAIALSVTVGASVNQGDVIGFAGDDAATYPHLHFETREKNNFEVSSRHPLRWLPYADTANFTAPVIDRTTRMTPTTMAARIRFGAPDREEGDLARISVDLRQGGAVLATREITFDDKTTIQEGNDESLMFTNDLAAEGYQSSNMTLYGFTDLDQGLLVRNIPAGTDNLTVRVIDIGGRTATGTSLPFTAPAGVDETATFESGALPPAGWATVTTTGMSLAVLPAAARAGALGLRCVDPNGAASFGEIAAVDLPVPAGRFEWVAEGWFRPISLSRSAPFGVYPIECLSGTNLSTAIWMWDVGPHLEIGLVAKDTGGALTYSNPLATLPPGSWHHLRMTLRRLGTRQATVFLHMDGVLKGFVNWSATAFEPTSVRMGIALSGGGLAVTMDADELRLTEGRDPPFPDLTPPAGGGSPAAPATGAALAEVVVRPTAIRPGDGVDCVIAERLVPGMTGDIYTRSGRKVRTLPAATRGTERWCLVDDAGADLPSGVYLFVLRDPAGARRTIKLALVR